MKKIMHCFSNFLYRFSHIFSGTKQINRDWQTHHWMKVHVRARVLSLTIVEAWSAGQKERSSRRLRAYKKSEDIRGDWNINPNVSYRIVRSNGSDRIDKSQLGFCRFGILIMAFRSFGLKAVFCFFLTQN